MKKYFQSSLALAFITTSSVLAKEITLIKGVGFEIGGGVNHLFWSSQTTIRIKTPGAGPVNRSDFTLFPNARINFYMPVYKNAIVMPFLGYNRMGGSSGGSSYTFDTCEAGFGALYLFAHFSFGLGWKVNYHLNAYYHSQSWDEERSQWFTKLSHDLGARVTYHLHSFSVSLEAWKGLDNLAAGLINDGQTNIKHNQYRLLIGYIIK